MAIRSFTANRISLISYAALGLIITAIFALNSAYGYWLGDFWEHCAVVREMATHVISPKHPILLLDMPHAFFSPYLLAVALADRYLGLSPVEALAVAGVLNLMLFLVALPLFIRSISPCENVFLTSLYSLIFILLFWPAASAWSMSGFFHFRVLGLVLPYPSTFAFVLTLFSFILYSRYLKSKNQLLALLLVLLIGATILTHPTTAVYTFAGIFALSLNKMKGFSLRPIIRCSLILAASILIAFLWPYYSLLDLVLKNNPEFHRVSLTLYEQLLARTYPLIIALPILFFRLKSNNKDILALMFLCGLMVYLAGYVTGNYGMGRVISFMAVICQVALGFFACQLTGRLVHRGGLSAALPMAVLLCLLVWLNPPNYDTLRHILSGRNKTYAAYEFLAKYTSQYDVILSDLKTSWMIPCFGGKTIASDNPLYWLPDHDMRRKDMADFFKPHVPPGELQEKILQKYGVAYILINLKKMRNHELFRHYGTMVYQNQDLRLIKIHAEYRR